MPNLRPVEILLIVLVVLLLFGAKRLPDLARGVGKSLKILKTEVKDLHDDDPAPASAPSAAAPTAAPTTPPSAVTQAPYPDAANRHPVAPSDDADRKQV